MGIFSKPWSGRTIIRSSGHGVAAGMSTGSTSTKCSRCTSRLPSPSLATRIQPRVHLFSEAGVMYRRPLVVIAALALSLSLGGARAQSSLTWSEIGQSVGTASTQCVPANAQRKALTIHNATAPGGTVNIGYCFWSSNTSACTAVIGNTGTYTLASGEFAFWPAGSAPINPISCIGSASSSPVSIGVGK